MIEKLEAILSLVPNAKVVVSANTIIWHSPSEPAVTDEQIEQEIVRLQSEKIRNEYKEKRAKEYPAFEDYLDGIVKGDQAQIQAYIDACLAIKAKYPKPE